MKYIDAEEIEKKARTAYPPDWKKLCGDGEVDANGERRAGYVKALAETESLPKIHGWVARDGALDYAVCLFTEKPWLPSANNLAIWHYDKGGAIQLPSAMFQNISPGSEPVEVELLIRKL